MSAEKRNGEDEQTFPVVLVHRDIGYRSVPAPTNPSYMMLSCSIMKVGHCVTETSS